MAQTGYAPADDVQTRRGVRSRVTSSTQPKSSPFCSSPSCCPRARIPSGRGCGDRSTRRSSTSEPALASDGARRTALQRGVDSPQGGCSSGRVSQRATATASTYGAPFVRIERVNNAGCGGRRHHEAGAVGAESAGMSRLADRDGWVGRAAGLLGHGAQQLRGGAYGARAAPDAMWPAKVITSPAARAGAAGRRAAASGSHSARAVRRADARAKPAVDGDEQQLAGGADVAVETGGELRFAPTMRSWRGASAALTRASATDRGDRRRAAWSAGGRSRSSSGRRSACRPVLG